MFDLTNKNALVTGATGGIGEEILKVLIAQGAKCIATGTNQEKLDNLSKKYDVKTRKCDIKNEQEIIDLVTFAEEKTGGIDILVCNAGITKDGLILRMKSEDWDDVINTNLKSSFLLTKNTVKGMLKRRYGRIIYISSVVGVAGNPGQANYVASKAGLIGLAKSVAQEVGSRGITVNCVAPGFIESPMTEVLTEAQSSAMLSKIPLGKFGKPSEVAACVAFLSSESAGYVTGETINVNGGMYMQ